nr:glycosyl hydrolase [Bacteroidales bacterium]
MKTRLILSLMLVVAWVTACGQSGQRGKQAAGNDVPVFLDDTKTIEERVEDALSRMTVEEKTAILHAQSKFSSAGVPRLGIPELWTSDGPHGIRPEVLWDKWSQAGWTSDSCTAFPALTALAASWDPDLAKLYGVSIGQEARYRKKDMLLGPGVNICRTPLNGRSFEYFGEDPFLSSTMVVPYVQGVQSNGVAACVKHYALNNQETNRFLTNVKVDDRTLYEIYLPAFKAAVQKGGAWAIMGSYNLYKDQWCCQNEYTLNGIL